MNNFNSNWDGVDRKTINTLSEASQQVIGKYRFTPFTEGSIKGWTISIQNYGKVGHIEEPSNKSSTAPFKIYRSNDPVFPAGKKAFVQGVLRMSAYPGTETRIVSEKEIRFAPRQLLKAVAMWLDKNGGMKEGVENNESADEVQSLDEVQFITPKVPLKGGSNSKGKTDNSHYAVLYADLKEVIKDAIGILSEAELKIRNPSKNSNLSVLGTIHQANQRLKHAINFGLR